MQTEGNRPTIGGIFLQHVIVFLICVVFPGGVTMMERILQIHGVGDQLAEVSVSPASIESVMTKSEDFLSSTKEGSTTIFAIANWKFGAIMGGLLTSFTVLYVIGYTLGALKWILSIRSAWK
jgi:hypothetical protein